MTIEGNILTADEGKILTNGDVYSIQVYLGIYDSPENWREVDIEEVPQFPDDEDKPYEEE